MICVFIDTRVKPLRQIQAKLEIKVFVMLGVRRWNLSICRHVADGYYCGKDSREPHNPFRDFQELTLLWTARMLPRTPLDQSPLTVL